MLLEQLLLETGDRALRHQSGVPHGEKSLLLAGYFPERGVNGCDNSSDTDDFSAYSRRGLIAKLGRLNRGLREACLRGAEYIKRCAFAGLAAGAQLAFEGSKRIFESI